MSLNSQAQALLSGELPRGVVEHTLQNGGRVIDCGVNTAGGLEAGLLLTRVCMAGLGDARLVPGIVSGTQWPLLQVTTDSPVSACLHSQYAGWRISIEKYFAMGSGPMRARATREELFQKLPVDESGSQVVGVLETGTLPGEDVTAYLADRCGITPADVTLLAAPTASIAGTIQVVGRSVETAMHKLFELGFDVNRVQHGFGTAPVPPVAKDDLHGIGRTNDAILYGGSVTLWLTGDDESIASIGPRVPASAANGYGRPFLDVFKEAGYDFYKIDPMLFSPGEVVFHNIETGNAFRFGQLNHDVLRQSFGV